MPVVGRSVYRGRMGQTRYLELDRSTQLPLASMNVKNKKLDHRVIVHPQVFLVFLGESNQRTTLAILRVVRRIMLPILRNYRVAFLAELLDECRNLPRRISRFI